MSHNWKLLRKAAEKLAGVMDQSDLESGYESDWRIFARHMLHATLDSWNSSRVILTITYLPEWIEEHWEWVEDEYGLFDLDDKELLSRFVLGKPHKYRVTLENDIDDSVRHQTFAGEV